MSVIVTHIRGEKNLNHGRLEKSALASVESEQKHSLVKLHSLQFDLHITKEHLPVLPVTLHLAADNKPPVSQVSQCEERHAVVPHGAR